MPSAARALATATTLLLAALMPAGAQPLSPAPQSPRLGQPLSADEAARADATVFADGRGLPPGRGDAAQGRTLYDAQCAACHGAAGSGGPGGRLVGRAPLTQSPWPDKTIGQFWPHATTLFDYTRRAMPLDRPGSLSADAVYALTAYLLHANEIIGAHDEMNATTLPRVRMPNRDGFVRMDRAAPAAPR